MSSEFVGNRYNALATGRFFARDEALNPLKNIKVDATLADNLFDQIR